MKAMSRSPGGNTDFFAVVAGVLQGDTLAQYMFVIYQDYVLQMSIDQIKNHYTLKKRQEADDVP